MIFEKTYRKIRHRLSPIRQKYRHYRISSIQEKMNGKYGLLLVNNKNVREKAIEVQFYNKMYSQYRDIIKKGIQENDAPKRNDTIWVCWLQGEENAPKLVQSCIQSMRKNMPDKKIVVLTEDTISQYIQFPDYILEKRNEGIISHAHFSDLLRTSLLCQYGGVWCDGTLLCTSKPPVFMTDDSLFVFKEIDLQRRDFMPTICSSWFISAWSNQKILLLTQKLLYEYWKTANDVGNYFCFHIFLAMAARRYPEEWKAIPFYNNHSPHTLQFELAEPYVAERWEQITTMSPLHKLNHHNDYSQCGKSFYQFIIETY